MPTQQRGFWFCDLCRASFDTAEEAQQHEDEQCAHRMRRSFPTAHAPLHPISVPVSYPQYAGQPPIHYQNYFSLQQPPPPGYSPSSGPMPRPPYDPHHPPPYQRHPGMHGPHPPPPPRPPIQYSTSRDNYPSSPHASAQDPSRPPQSSTTEGDDRSDRQALSRPTTAKGTPTKGPHQAGYEGPHHYRSGSISTRQPPEEQNESPDAAIRDAAHMTNFDYPGSRSFNAPWNVQQPQLGLLLPLDRPTPLLLTTHETVTCQQIEVFVAGPYMVRQETSAAPMERMLQAPWRDSAGHAVEPGRVGLRCAHCFKHESDGSNDEGLDHTSYVFPDSLLEASIYVRKLRDSHLRKCPMIPAELREIMQKGQKEDEQNGITRAMMEYCSARFREMGVFQRDAGSPGLVYSLDAPRRQRIFPSYSYPESQRPRSDYEHNMRHHVLAPGQFAPATAYPVPEGSESRKLYDETPFYSSDAGYQTMVGEGAIRDRRIERYGSDDGTSTLVQVDVPSHFPFFQDQNGEWLCKFCAHIPPQFREEHFVWSVPNCSPPPGEFIDYHLQACQGYHASIAPPSVHDEPPSSNRGFTHPQGRLTLVTGGSNVRDQDVGSGKEPISVSLQYDPIAPRYALPRYREIDEGGYNTAENMAARGARFDALSFLQEQDKSGQTVEGSSIAENSRLVLDEDALLLTHYFFWIMKQLRMTHFAESDRKTRGGKRESVRIGYGGLECVHCAGTNNPRKFFWSNVDRLANSFAEIPSHTLKCRRCPEPIKQALLSLKETHAEEMAKLPRGSQKVFFRRMWRRLHGEKGWSPEKAEGETVELSSTGDAVSNSSLKDKLKLTSSPSETVGSDDTQVVIERTTHEAARVLASTLFHDGPPSPSSRVVLAIPDDKEWLSDTDCFIRRQIEIFVSSTDDVSNASIDRKFPVHEGQVGIRCLHCALTTQGATGHAVMYPFSINGIYESVREFQRLHLDTCPNRPTSVIARCANVQGSSSLSSVLRKYYVLAARALGLHDTAEGIRAGGQAVPLGSQAAFAFTETGSPSSKVSEEMRRSVDEIYHGKNAYEQATVSPYSSDSRKREFTDSPGSEKSNKISKAVVK